MNDQTFRKKIIDIFNRGAARLYLYSEYESLRIDEGDCCFVLDTIILKSNGRTNRDKYNDIRKRCISLFRKIRDRRLTGFYFTPRTLIDKWKYLGTLPPAMSSKEFYTQPWVMQVLAARCESDGGL